jgi:hypothetical protein
VGTRVRSPLGPLEILLVASDIYANFRLDPNPFNRRRDSSTAVEIMETTIVGAAPLATRASRRPPHSSSRACLVQSRQTTNRALQLIEVLVVVGGASIPPMLPAPMTPILMSTLLFNLMRQPLIRDAPRRIASRPLSPVMVMAGPAGPSPRAMVSIPSATMCGVSGFRTSPMNFPWLMLAFKTDVDLRHDGGRAPDHARRRLLSR